MPSALLTQAEAAHATRARFCAGACGGNHARADRPTTVCILRPQQSSCGLWPGRWPAASASTVPFCTQHINEPTAAAAPHCFTCRSDSDRMLLLLSWRLRQDVRVDVHPRRARPQAVRTGVPTPCPWLGARARRRCRSSRRSAAVSSRARKHCSRLDRRPSRSGVTLWVWRHLCAGWL